MLILQKSNCYNKYMDKEKQKEIYEMWKFLEDHCRLEANDVLSSRPIVGKYIEPQKMMDLGKYRKWVLAYCAELLDLSEKWELERFEENYLKCKCVDTNCAKSLLVNCQDDDCYFHPKDYSKRYDG